MAATVTEYCTSHSNDVSDNMKELWEWTCDQFEDADKMSSPLQGATMKFLAEHQQAKRGMYIQGIMSPQPPIAERSANDGKSSKSAATLVTVRLRGTKQPKQPKLKSSLWSSTRR